MKLIFLLLLFFSVTAVSQEDQPKIHLVQELDSILVDKKISYACKTLDIDTNWRPIFEPPGVCRGIRTEYFEDCEIQIYVERGSVSLKRLPSRSKAFKAHLWKQLKSQKIIGISWRVGNRCGSFGEVIFYYAYNRFGPCD